MANKKINQLVAKTTIQSTDLFPLGDASTGQLFKKTIAELQAAIGGAVISVNGLVGTVVLDTDDIQELATPTNKYFTDARARGAISLTVTGNSGASTYSNSTGVLNVPTYTLAGLGGITASFLSGGTGITYNSTTGVIAYSGTVFTDASIRALVSAGAGLSYNSSTGVFSYSGTVYTDASIRALISLTTTGSSGASTYNNTTGVLNVPTYTLAGLGGIGAGFLSGGAGITYNSTTGVIASTITQYTDALARASISAGTGISYNSGTGVITYSGTVYTDASVRGLLSGTAPITYNSTTGAIGITQASGAANGFLSSTDWTTFNNKQNALTLGNFTEVNSNVFMFPDGGTNKVIGNLTIQMIQAGASTNGYLSSGDWTTFNNKQNAITLTTTGTSGAATFSSGTLNIPQYQAVLTNPVTGTGTTNYVAKFTSSSAIGNSNLITDSAGSLGLNAAPSAFSTNVYFDIVGNTTTQGGIIQTRNSDNTIIGSFFTNANGLNVRTETNNSILLSTAGTERLRISSTGNIGVGNIIPASFDSAANQLVVGNGTTNQGITIYTSTTTEGSLYFADGTGASSYRGYIYYNHTSDFMAFGTNAVRAITITSTGNLLLGTTTDKATVIGGLGTGQTIAGSGTPNLAIWNTGNADWVYSTAVGNDGTVYHYNRGNTSMYYYTNGLERLQIDAAGAIVIKGASTTSLLRGLIENTNSYFNIYATEGGGLTKDFGIQNGGSASAGRVILKASGNFLIGTDTDNGERLYVSGSIRATGSITANSDVRLKKNIERIENALQKVSEISGYTYNTIYDEDRHAGVIAQEIDKVLPEIVNKGNDGLMGVEYGNISALLIEAIKDLKVQNDSLLARLSALEK